MSYFSYTPYDRSSNIAATLNNINTSFTGILNALVKSVKAVTPNVVTLGGTVTSGSFPALSVAATEAIIAGVYHTVSSGSVSALAGNNTVTYVYLTSSGAYASGSSVPTGAVPLAITTNNSTGTAIASIVDVRPFNQTSANGVTVVTGSSYTIAQTDKLVVSNPSTTTAVSIVLPANPVAGKEVAVKDGKGDSFSNNVTVTPGPGVSTIDGRSTFVIESNYESAWFIFNGTEWNVV